MKQKNLVSVYCTILLVVSLIPFLRLVGLLVKAFKPAKAEEIAHNSDFSGTFSYS